MQRRGPPAGVGAAEVAEAQAEAPAEFGDRKPAKPDDDLVSYVRQLEIPLQALLGPASNSSAPVLSDEDSLLIKNAFREINRKEASLSTHKMCSVALEALLRLASAKQLAGFLTGLQAYCTFTCTNRFGSHVLETLFGQAHRFLVGNLPLVVRSDEDEEEDDADAGAADWKTEAGARDALVQVLLQWAQLLRERIAALLFDSAGTHVLRSVASLLAGLDPRAHSHSHTAGGPGAGKDAKSGPPGHGPSGGAGGPPSHERAGAAALAAAAAYPAPSALQAESRRLYAAVRAPHAALLQCGLINLVHALAEADYTAAGTEAATETVAAAPELTPLAEGGEGSAAAIAVEAAAKVLGAAPHPADDAAGLPAGLSAGRTIPLEAPTLGTAEDSNVVAMGCDTYASATVQHLVKATAAACAAGVHRYVCRRLVGLPLTDLSPADISGATDLQATLGGAADGGSGAAGGKGKKKGSSKDKDKAAASAAAAGVPDTGASATMRLLVESLSTHPTGARLLEALLSYADAPLHAALYAAFFRPHLGEVMADAAANFVLQRLLTSCHSLAQAEGVVADVLIAAEAASAAGPEPAVDAEGEEGGGAEGAAGRLRAGRGYDLSVLCDNKREGIVLHAIAVAAGGAAIAPAPPAPVLSLGHKAGGGGAAEGAPAKPASHSVPLVPIYTGTQEPLPVEAQQAVVRSLVATAAAGAKGAAAGVGLSTHLSAQGPGHTARWWLDLNGYRASGLPLSDPHAPEGGRHGGGGAGAADASTAGVPLDRQLPLVPLSPAGTRIVAACLRLSPAASKPLLESVLGLQGVELAVLCCDPFISRHLMEPLLQSRDPGLTWAKHKLLSNLRGYWARVAAGKFGAWVVTKAMAEAADTPRRRQAIAEELAAAEAALGGAPAGRTVLKFCRIEHFRKNADSWQAAWARAGSQLGMLAGILQTHPNQTQGHKAKGPAAVESNPGAEAAAASSSGKRADKPAKAAADDAAAAAPSAADAAVSGKKRRRRESADEAAEAATAADGAADGEEGEEGGKKSRKDKKERKEAKEAKRSRREREAEADEAAEAPVAAAKAPSSKRARKEEEPAEEKRAPAAAPSDDEDEDGAAGLTMFAARRGSSGAGAGATHKGKADGRGKAAAADAGSSGPVRGVAEKQLQPFLALLGAGAQVSGGKKGKGGSK